VNRVALWRVVIAAIVLAALALFVALFTPIYFHNLRLQNYVAKVTASPGIEAKSDDVLRTWVVDRAHQLDLPIHADDVKIARSTGGLHIDVRYQVKVDLPGYTVNLHFYPGAGSR
jgi:predicted membrane protein